MTLRLCLLALGLVACSREGLDAGGSISSTSDTQSACDTLDEADCKARTDCAATECGFCGGTSYAGCAPADAPLECPSPSAGCPAVCPAQGTAATCDSFGCTSAYTADLVFYECVSPNQSCTAPPNVDCLRTVTCPDGYAPLYDELCAEYCIEADKCTR